ncbi:hypothetical protein TUSST3_62770 [Streptomyces sp. TUS-ST3]|nr:hypothetical protein TUSST3_62770 [Streptomyces sp. TUS-ST3]
MGRYRTGPPHLGFVRAAPQGHLRDQVGGSAATGLAQTPRSRNQVPARHPWPVRGTRQTVRRQANQRQPTPHRTTTAPDRPPDPVGGSAATGLAQTPRTAPLTRGPSEAVARKRFGPSGRVRSG